MLVWSMFFWFFSGNKDLGTKGTRELGKTPWVDSYDLLPIVLAAFGSLFVFATSFWYTSNSLYHTCYVLVLYLLDVGLVQLGSMSSFSLRWVHVPLFFPDSFVLSTWLISSTIFGTRYIISIYPHWYPPIYSPTYYFLFIQKL